MTIERKTIIMQSKNFNLDKNINYIAEVSGLLRSYSFWLQGINKRQVPWEEARLCEEFFSTGLLEPMGNFLPGEDFSAYRNFLKAVKGSSLKVLEEFFVEENADILDLIYIHKSSDKNQYGFLIDLLSSSDQLEVEDYSLEDFHLDLYKTFGEFFYLEDEVDQEESLSDPEEIYDLVKSCDYIEVLAKSSFSPDEILKLIKALDTYEDLYYRLKPLIKALEKIIKDNLSLIADRIENSYKDLETSDFAFARSILKDTGFEDYPEKIGQAIKVSLRLVDYNVINLIFSSLRPSGPNICLGLLTQDLIKTKESAYKETVFQRKLKALGDPTRFSIINLLRKRPYYLQELAEELHLSPATLSYHINQLQMDGFLSYSTQGRRSYYSLRKEGFEDLEKSFEYFLQGGHYE